MVVLIQAHSYKNEQVQPISPSIKLKHDQEQEFLDDCNDRLNNYIQRVVNLETEKNKLLNEVNFIFTSWGNETRSVIRDKEPELNEARNNVDVLCDIAARDLAKSRRLEFDASFLKQNIEDELYASDCNSQKKIQLENSLESCKEEADFLQKVYEEKKDEIKKSVENNNRLSYELKNLLEKLEESNYNCIRIDSQNQTLAEQIPFLKAVHEVEFAEMKKLLDRSKVDPVQFYKNEIQRAIADIRKDFAELNLVEKAERDDWYKLKSEELKIILEKREIDELPRIKEVNKGLQETFEVNYKELADLDSKQKEVENTCSKFEEEYQKLKRQHASILSNQDLLIAEAKKIIEDYLNDYDYLLQNKSSFEFELNTMKRLIGSTVGGIQAENSSMST
jgi:chromosome segregation ATPase